MEKSHWVSTVDFTRQFIACRMSSRENKLAWEEQSTHQCKAKNYIIHHISLIFQHECQTYNSSYIRLLANLKRCALLQKKPVVIRRLSLIQYLLIYLACISLVYALWQIWYGFTEYLEPSYFCLSPLPNPKLWKLELRDSYILPSRYTTYEGWWIPLWL